jgi:3D (Asp-Asp-Asp) domain-containing protein
MPTLLKLTFVLVSAAFVVGCAEQPRLAHSAAAKSGTKRLKRIRTTAYSRGESGGLNNAVGRHLSGHRCLSAASDWSRFPLGTRFRIVGSNEEYIIDDYGTALVGTNTIDLYKTTRLDMKRWGVRHVDIDILEWGSEENSLRVLRPRAKHRAVQRMIVALRNKASGPMPSPPLY